MYIIIEPVKTRDRKSVDERKYTGWLKLKYPTGQNAISRQPCEIFTPKFLDLYGRDPATILNLKKNILVCSKVMAVKIFYAIFIFQFCTE